MTDTAFCDVDTKIEFLARQVCVDIIRRDFHGAGKLLAQAMKLHSDPAKHAEMLGDGVLLESVSRIHRKYFVPQMRKFGLVTIGDLRREIGNFEERMDGAKKSRYAVYYKGEPCHKLGRKIFAEMKMLAHGKVEHKF
jgi:hypothetical protein